MSIWAVLWRHRTDATLPLPRATCDKITTKSMLILCYAALLDKRIEVYANAYPETHQRL